MEVLLMLEFWMIIFIIYKNDFFTSKYLSETNRNKGCKKLNQSLAEYIMNKAG